MINFSYGLAVGVSIVLLVFGGLLQQQVIDNTKDLERIKERMNIG